MVCCGCSVRGPLFSRPGRIDRSRGQFESITGRSHEVAYPQELTSSAHIRSPSFIECPRWGSGAYTLAIFTDLEALISGTQIAIPNIDPEFARENTSINIVLEGT